MEQCARFTCTLLQHVMCDIKHYNNNWLWSYFFQLSEPVDVTGVVILWRKKDTDVDFYTKPDSSHGSFYSLNGLEANTTYEIQIQIMIRSHSGPKSTSAFATTHENQDGMWLSVISFFSDKTEKKPFSSYSCVLPSLYHHLCCHRPYHHAIITVSPKHGELSHMLSIFKLPCQVLKHLLLHRFSIVSLSVSSATYNKQNM